VSDARDLLNVELARASYLIREIKAVSNSKDEVELAAALALNTAKPRELDGMLAALKGLPLVR